VHTSVKVFSPFVGQTFPFGDFDGNLSAKINITTQWRCITAVYNINAEVLVYA